MKKNQNKITLNIDLTKNEKQALAWKLFFDPITTEIGYGGGARGGKSWFSSELLTYLMCTYADTRFLLGRKELKTLKKTSLITLFKVFKHHGLKRKTHYIYNQQDSLVKLWNESEMLLTPLAYQPSDPLYTELGGLEITGAAIEESNEVPVTGIDIVKSRVGNWNNEKYGIKPFLIQTFNPDKGHVYHRFYKPWKEKKELDYRKFIQALVTDNPYANPAYIEELKRATKITRERLLYGNFEYDEDPNVLMEYDAIVDLFTNYVDHSEEKFMTIDVARLGMDKSVIMLWKGLKVYRIVVIPKCKINELVEKCEQLRREEQISLRNCIADEDGVGGGLVDFMGCRGFIANRPAHVTNGDTSLTEEYAITQDETIDSEDRLVSNYSNLRSQCYHTLADYVNTSLISISCDDEEVKEDIIEELEQIKAKDADKDGKRKIISKDEIKEHLGRSPDFADTLMMRMFFEVSKEPTPGLEVL